MRENFLEPAESSRRNEGNDEIMDMLRSMKKEMVEREEVGEVAANQRRIPKS